MKLKLIYLLPITFFALACNQIIKLNDPGDPGTLTHLLTTIIECRTGFCGDPPTSVSAAPGLNTNLISWQNARGAKSYNLYWSTNSNFQFTEGNKISNVSSPYVHSGINNGTTYYYILTSVSSQLEQPSSTVSATPTANLSFNGSWTCSTGQNCQDIYSFDLISGFSFSISVSSVTGSSVIRLAIFGPNTTSLSVSNTNLINGTTKETECFGQDVGDSRSISIPSSGTYYAIVGRDWGASGGASGNYTLTATGNGNYLSQPVNDVNSYASGVSCP